MLIDGGAFKLQAHQEAAINYFMQSPYRGILMHHAPGSGKTLTAISIAERLADKFSEVLLIAPKSLHDNFKNELERFGTEKMDKYRFISSNAGNMIDKVETSYDPLTGVQMKELRLDNKLIIIDEVHNLLIGMSNGSKNATALYDMLMRAKNSRIILMTASMAVNTLYEAVIALNIVRGPIRTDSNEWTTLLPESREDFEKYFVDLKLGKLKHENKLKNRIRGLVSYRGELFDREILDFYKMLKTTIKQPNYPDRLPIKIDTIHMSPQQYQAYEGAREKERLETMKSITGKGETIYLCPNETKGGELKNNKMFGKSTSYRIRSRQISNVYNPDENASEMKMDDLIAFYKDIEDMEKYSPKIKKIGSLLDGKKTIIYSNFVKSGICPMAGHLEHLGYLRYDSTKEIEKDKKYYGIYSGDVSTDDRTATLKEYNKADSALEIILISSSGAEGLSAKGTRHIHIMEPYWNYERIIQVIARGIRFHSHSHLPEDQQNVQVYVYLAILPKGVVDKKERTTDMHLFIEAANKYQINSQMIKLMASVSIECNRFNKGVNFKCYQCKTKDGVPLYIPDLAKDMLYEDPCSKTELPDTIVAKEYIIGNTLYYVSDDDRVFMKTNEAEYNELIDADIKSYILSSVKSM